MIEPQIFKIQLPIGGNHYQILMYNKDRSIVHTVESEKHCAKIVEIVNHELKSFWWVKISDDPKGRGKNIEFIREADWQDW